MPTIHILFCGREGLALRGHWGHGSVWLDDGATAHNGNFHLEVAGATQPTKDHIYRTK